MIFYFFEINFKSTIFPIQKAFEFNLILQVMKGKENIKKYISKWKTYSEKAAAKLLIFQMTRRSKS